MNRYALYTDEQLSEHFSRFLVDSWSYSSIQQFARNEKEYERRYIYREPFRSGVSAVAGTAYHAAVQLYFERLRDLGESTPLAELQQQAWRVIDETPANRWQLSKTAPTIEDAAAAATAIVNAALDNFLREIDVYTDSVAEYTLVERRIEQWVTVNGVDIPLPLHAVLDLAATLVDGRTVIIDHKSKKVFTDTEEAGYTHGKQAITYALAYEAQFPERHVDEVWFIENKYSKNKDRSPQLRKHVITLDADTRRLYQAILYEPLRRTIEAVSDPDYVFTINDSDNFVSRSEIYDFWAKTMLADIGDFNIPDDKRPLMEQRQRKIRDASAAAVSPKVITSFRRKAATFISYELREDMTNSEKIEHALRSLGIQVRVAHQLGEYSSVSYLLEVAAGVNLASIQKYRLNIANAINVPSVRILPELVPYQGKTHLCIEAPNRSDHVLYWDQRYLSERKIPVGVDNYGQTVTWDLDRHDTPHILVCGATGSGKSVMIRSTIEFALAAGIHDVIIFDPKYEFTDCSARSGVTVYNDIEDIESQMQLLVADMQARARDSSLRHKTLVVFDEFADAVGQARSRAELAIKDDQGKVVGYEKSLEENLKMLLQKGRSLGFNILAATQRASVKVISGDAKANFPVQVCFRLPKAVDSKVVIDEEGAETLAGHGDGLIKSPQYFGTRRFQGFYYS